MTKTIKPQPKPLKSANQKMCERSLKFINKYKGHFGFSDWTLTVEDQTDVPGPGGIIARTACNHYEKMAKVILFEDFIDEDAAQDSVLIHELIHARHEVKEKKIEEKVRDIEYHEEEDMVNDITRGFMKFITEQ